MHVDDFFVPPLKLSYIRELIAQTNDEQNTNFDVNEQRRVEQRSVPSFG